MLALSRAGELYSFGSCQRGQLGHGDTMEQQHPRLVVALNSGRVSAVSAGQFHSLVLSEAGEIYSFGSGRHGQLGHGDQADQHTPRPIASLQGVRMGAVAAGDDHSLVVSLAGSLYSFRRGQHGMLGHGDTLTQRTPLLVEALEGVRVSAVAAGLHHSLVVSGAGEFGQLGHGDQTSQLTPRVIAGLQGMRARSVAAGSGTSLAIMADWEAYGWGLGYDEDADADDVGDPLLGLELTYHQLVPLNYLGLILHA